MNRQCGKIVVNRNNFFPTNLIPDEKFSRWLTFDVILKLMAIIMEIIKIMVKNWEIPLSRINDRSLAIDLLERLPWTTQKSLPLAPVTFDFFLPCQRVTPYCTFTAFDSSVPSTAAHFKGRYFFPRRSRCSRRLHEPSRLTNEHR